VSLAGGDAAVGWDASKVRVLLAAALPAVAPDTASRAMMQRSGISATQFPRHARTAIQRPRVKLSRRAGGG